MKTEISDSRAADGSLPSGLDDADGFALEGEEQALLLAHGEKEIVDLVALTHSGMTPDEYHRLARAWLDSARHPRFHHLYKECVYRPQLELLANKQGWLVVSMKRDFKTVFAFEK